MGHRTARCPPAPAGNVILFHDPETLEAQPAGGQGYPTGSLRKALHGRGLADLPTQHEHREQIVLEDELAGRVSRMEKQIRLQRAFLHWMGLPAHSPLSGKQLIEHLGIVLVQPVEIPEIPAELLHEVLNGSSEHWSDITFCDRSTRPVIIHNPKHAPSRQESDLMHETAHILCRHLPAKIVSVGDFALRTYDANHEKEAEWLGACLQITREGLLWAVRRRMTNQQIADLFGASEALIRFRRSTTAVDVQMTRRYSGWSTR